MIVSGISEGRVLTGLNNDVTSVLPEVRRPTPNNDFNGDGDTERAVYRSGAWYVEGMPTV
ncbi:hypothetical protein BH23ACT12_BH23ACT12_15680 [soil metagenome]